MRAPHDSAIFRLEPRGASGLGYPLFLALECGRRAAPVSLSAMTRRVRPNFVALSSLDESARLHPYIFVLQRGLPHMPSLGVSSLDLGLLWQRGRSPLCRALLFPRRVLGSRCSNAEKPMAIKYRDIQPAAPKRSSLKKTQAPKPAKTSAPKRRGRPPGAQTKKGR